MAHACFWLGTASHGNPRGLLRWLAYNVRRDVSENPGPDPDLTPELLAKVLEVDLETLQRTAMLFEQS